MKYRVLIFFLLLTVFAWDGTAKVNSIFEKCEQDSNFVQSYRNDLLFRIYTSNKVNFFKLKDTQEKFAIKYRPNDFYNLGIGFNYKTFGINIGTPFPFSTKDESKFGKTTTFGIQSYMYKRKFTIDLLAKKTKGFFIHDSDDILAGYDDQHEYHRRDIETQNFGLNVNYIFNNERFSHRAAFNQTEKQLRSAGSLLAGLGVYSFLTKADSALVPREIDPNYFVKNRSYKGGQTISLNLNVGYAYSLVFAKNWLLTGSLIVSGGVEQLRFKYVDQKTEERFKLNYNSQVRLGFGYQHDKYKIGVSMIRFLNASPWKVQQISVTNGSDFIRFSITRRIELGKRKR